MLDLSSMSDEEFTVLVTPSVPQAAMYVTVEESGKVYLSSKVAEKVAKTPVHIRFNRDYTAIQISKADAQEKSILFPKNGRKSIPDAAGILKRNHIPLPAVFQGYFCTEFEKWRGERQPNPTAKPSPTIRNTKKK